MSNFKKVLEIEKKYEHIINNAKYVYEKELEKFKEDLLLEKDAIKQDYKKELERDLQKEIKKFKVQGMDMLKNAREESDFIYKNAKKEVAVKLLLENIQNV